MTAVGDRSASALVRARAATGSPCYQHVLEMFRGASYDAALLMANEGAAQAAEGAANAGAAVLLAGDRVDGFTMIEAAEATMRARVPFAVLRPRLQQAGIAFLASLAASDAGWRPRFLDVSMSGPGDAMELMRDAIALGNRLMLAAPISTVGSAIGDEDLPESTAVTAELRYAEGLLASLRARTSSTEQTTLFADCPLGELELQSHAGVTTLTVSSRDGRSETSKLTDGDTLALEARRATRRQRAARAGTLAGDGAGRDGGGTLDASEPCTRRGSRRHDIDAARTPARRRDLASGSYFRFLFVALSAFASGVGSTTVAVTCGACLGGFESSTASTSPMAPPSTMSIIADAPRRARLRALLPGSSACPRRTRSAPNPRQPIICILRYRCEYRAPPVR